ncbi:putative myristylated membrane protein 3 [Diachasmimorpha longicaudata entomopoxvirus]|uniref:Putative myristylated membrane protein 3 n=1 Tax=Diachasmimorpha longicaudata entomopoxvirus TaxID=109981 RepID=A0A7R5WJD9_9POXV|nr:putative myristylated membrane protein 3 [Diachasmimorpha longicaudata entomopoxvirus]AKS26423.1 putative myristylated membrane protein 3 [Diachasmimorpha longicaudata entomopoxvirus]
MGVSASIQTTITNINNEITYHAEQNSKAESRADCKITIGSILYENVSGCRAVFKNICSATADTQIDSMIDLIVKNVDKLTNDQKQHAATLFTATFGISTSVNNISETITHTLKQTCKSKAIVNETISGADIKVKNCVAPPGEMMDFEFVNMGTAGSSCVSKMLHQFAVAAINDVTNRQAHGTDWTKFFWPLAIFLMVSSVGFIILKLFANKIASPKERMEINASKFDNYAQRIKTLYPQHIMT